jgi:hypothetical protein
MELIKSSWLIIVIVGKRKEWVGRASEVNEVSMNDFHCSIASEYAFHNIGQDQFDSFLCGVL